MTPASVGLRRRRRQGNRETSSGVRRADAQTRRGDPGRERHDALVRRRRRDRAQQRQRATAR
jgi:hypothetical protein